MLALLGALAGCSVLQPSAKVSYYQMDYPAPSMLPATPPLNTVLGLRRFGIATLYDHDRLVQRGKYLQTTQSYYHRWAANPRMMLSDLLLRDLQATGNYQAVVLAPSTVAMDYEISGFVREIAQDDSGAKPSVKLALEISLLRGAEQKGRSRIVFQKPYTAEIPCPDRSAAGVAKAMSAAFQDISAKIRQDLYEAIASSPNP